MSIIIFLFGAFFSLAITEKTLGTSAKRSIAIYSWHSVWMVAFYIYIKSFGGDALDYYLNTPHIIGPSLTGSNLIYASVHTLKEQFNASLFECFLIFNIFGAVSLIFYDAIFTELTKRNKTSHIAATIFILLPSFSFWTAGIGKDGLTILALSISLWAMIDILNRRQLFSLSIIIAALVRPQIAAFIFISFVVSIFFNQGISKRIKLLAAAASSLLLYWLTPYFLEYISYTSIYGSTFNTINLMKHIKFIQSENMVGSGAINLNTANILEIVFNYLFKPTIFEMKSMLYAAQGLENTLLLLLFMFLIYRRRTAALYPAPKHLIVYIFIFAALCLTAYSAISSNVGIAVRTKWCVLPFLLSLLLISFRKSEKIIYRNEASTSLTQ